MRLEPPLLGVAPDRHGGCAGGFLGRLQAVEHGGFVGGLRSAVALVGNPKIRLTNGGEMRSAFRSQ
jgi:hypothetical protein